MENSFQEIAYKSFAIPQILLEKMCKGLRRQGDGAPSNFGTMGDIGNTNTLANKISGLHKKTL